MSYKFEYEPLKGSDYDVVSVNFPDMDKSENVPVQTTDAKSPQTYHTKNPREVVEFSVKLKAVDTDSGKELLPKVKELVEGVLKDDYEAKPAKVMRLKKDGENVEEERDIQNCVIKSGSITTAKGESIEVDFNMEGLLGTSEK